MSKIPDCDRCRFYAHSSYMGCGVNPSGPEGSSCPEFESVPLVEQREPLEGGYYASDWIPQLRRVTTEKQLDLQDTHPLFTERCPNCEEWMRQTDPPRVHWDCGDCGWVDDSI